MASPTGWAGRKGKGEDGTAFFDAAPPCQTRGVGSRNQISLAISLWFVMWLGRWVGLVIAVVYRGSLQSSTSTTDDSQYKRSDGNM